MKQQPYYKNQDLLDFVGESDCCGELNLPDVITNEYLNELYAAKSDWELLIDMGTELKDWSSVKSDKASLQQIKKLILAAKEKMQNQTKETKTAA